MSDSAGTPPIAANRSFALVRIKARMSTSPFSNAYNLHMQLVVPNYCAANWPVRLGGTARCMLENVEKMFKCFTGAFENVAT